MTQLFKKEPTPELLSKVLNSFGTDDFKDEYSFRKKDLAIFDTINKINHIKEELGQYYYPCKAKLYIENITENKCITILRQFLRHFGYNLVSKEKYSLGEKYIVYSMSSTHHMKSPKTVVIQFNM